MSQVCSRDLSSVNLETDTPVVQVRRVPSKRKFRKSPCISWGVKSRLCSSRRARMSSPDREKMNRKPRGVRFPFM